MTMLIPEPPAGEMVCHIGSPTAPVHVEVRHLPPLMRGLPERFAVRVVRANGDHVFRQDDPVEETMPTAIHAAHVVFNGIPARFLTPEDAR